jgi:hypothetical protein
VSSTGWKKNRVLDYHWDHYWYERCRSGMAKKVVLNGVEIYTVTNVVPSKKLFDFVRKVMESIDSELCVDDKNPCLKIQFRFLPRKKPNHRIRLHGIKRAPARDRIIKVLRRSTSAFTKGTAKGIQVDILLQTDRRG